MSRLLPCFLTVVMTLCSTAPAHDGDHDPHRALAEPAAAASGSARIVVDHSDGPTPWTNLRFNNDADNFQFIIVSDRSGNPRKGVFEDAVRKINLLQPEFVMSVGDLIQGYNDNPLEIDRQWDEFEAFVQKLTMPFFFVPGNHDVSNSLQVQKWTQRFGRLYYHFVYRDVLFLCLNSDDDDARIGEEQIDYFRRVLEQNKDVRWTLVFLHRPLWGMAQLSGRDGETRFSEMDALLEGRRYTVFAGHWHQYTRWERNDRRHFVLATTGGGSRLMGPRLGSFDHLVWCTMTDDGPVVANLMLDGIWDEDVVTTEARSLIRRLRESAQLTVPSFYTDQRTFDLTTRQLRLQNDADEPMEVKLSFEPHPSISVRPHAQHVMVPPNSVEMLELELSSAEPVPVAQLTPLIMNATLTYQVPGEPAVEFRDRHLLAVEAPYPLPRAAEDVEVDGRLDEWAELPYAADHESQVSINGGQWLGPDDGSFRFAVMHDDRFVYIGLRATDDRHIYQPSAGPRQQDALELRLDARPIEQREHIPPNDRRGEILVVTVQLDDEGEMILRHPAPLPNDLEVQARKTDSGYDVEFAVPKSYLAGRSGGEWTDFRLNLVMHDADELGYLRDVIWWKPLWGSAENYANSGTFRRDR